MYTKFFSAIVKLIRNCKKQIITSIIFKYKELILNVLRRNKIVTRKFSTRYLFTELFITENSTEYFRGIIRKLAFFLLFIDVAR